MWATGKHSNKTPWQQPCRQNDHGFTLIELLVVIIIIGLMASVVALTLPSSRETLNDESNIIAARLELAAQEAIISGNVIGLSLNSDGYRFLRRVRGQWQAYAPSGLKGTLPWPEDVKLAFSYEGEKITLSGPVGSVAGSTGVSSNKASNPNSGGSSNNSPNAPNAAHTVNTKIIPNVYFLPSGETQNFNLTLSGPNEEITITVSANGQISQTATET